MVKFSSRKVRNLVWYCTWTTPTVHGFRTKEEHHHINTFSEKKKKKQHNLGVDLRYMNTESWKYDSGETKYKCFNMNSAS